ncbi:MAG: 3-hydroxyacyl-CoA dehydrogenase NAD-binding domain-containing protein, partial [Dehalococcoidia bacterium]|nr:3-hydroxyacyl-CoA dehydrogenase NAD-binding domain-containing protein [Dehalococcoidia bacterium]
QDVKKGLTRESPAFRNKLALMGIQGTQGARPPAMFVPNDAKLITPGNFEDNLEWLSEVDWIIEGIVEDLEIKKELLKKVEKFVKPGTIISTNTSGLSIEKISEGLSEEIRRNFLGTHFFNPPRHMKLLEIIPGKTTDKDVLSFMEDFCEKRLGKSVVFAKDTPNFIANRIGAYAVIGVMNMMEADGYTIEEADAITGPPMGRPKSASFRTSDMVGLDTFLKVAHNVCENIDNGQERQAFSVPQFINKMVESGLLGDKTQKGFYQKVFGPGGSEILTLDYSTMDYVPQRKPDLPLLNELRKEGDLAAGLRKLVYSDDRAGRFAWKTLKRMLLYSAARVPEIADDIISVDRAMRWGFNWELGPFETWDAIGLKKSVGMMEKEGDEIPENVLRMLKSGRERFYEKRDGKSYYYDFSKADYVEIEGKPQIIILPSLKERSKLVKSNAGATLLDMGDGVACLEFTTPNTTIDPDVIQMMFDSVAEVEENFEGLVIGNQGANFCVGADLKGVFPAAQNKEWDALEKALYDFQMACMRVKYSEKPVVAAPFRMALGGGCEVCLAASLVRAHVECYMGLVEFGVGVIPAGGGTKELLLRATDWVPPSIPSAVPGGGKPDILPYVARTFETIAMAKVSTCTQEARDLGFLTPYDRITMNWDHLLYDAKQSVLSLVKEGYRPPRPRDSIRVTGRTGMGLLELLVYLLKEGLYISDHDAVVARKLAYVLTGGDVDQNTLVTEEYLLELEREAFMSLCGEEKTRARMKQMIETGKPLRN